jgi:hypothetical protein
MAVNINSYLFRRVLRISAFDISTNELYGSLTRFSNVTFNNTQEQTDVTASGVIIARLDYGKQASFTVEVPVVSDFLLSLTSGTTAKQLTNVTDIAIPDTFVVRNNVGTAKYGGTGAAGSEIKYAYLVDNQGAPVKTFVQDAAAGVGKFSYSAVTKVLTFNTGEVPDGSTILIYSYPTVSSAKLIVNDSNNFSLNARVLIDVVVSDVCDPSKEYLLRILFENGKFSGNYDWAVSGTDPTTMSVEVASMLPCGTSELWRAYIFDNNDVMVG